MDFDLNKYRHTHTWFVNSEIHRYLLNHCSKFQKLAILEIGAFEGLSTCCFSDNLLHHPESFLVTVDPFLLEDTTTSLTDDTETIFRHNLSQSKNLEKCQHRKMRSQDFFPQNDCKFDLIYVDGSHLIDDLLHDMNASFKVLHSGGIMWMDDYHKSGEIKEAMDKWFRENNGSFIFLHSGYQVAIRKN